MTRTSKAPSTRSSHSNSHHFIADAPLGHGSIAGHSAPSTASRAFNTNASSFNTYLPDRHGPRYSAFAPPPPAPSYYAPSSARTATPSLDHGAPRPASVYSSAATARTSPPTLRQAAPGSTHSKALALRSAASHASSDRSSTDLPTRAAAHLHCCSLDDFVKGRPCTNL